PIFLRPTCQGAYCGELSSSDRPSWSSNLSDCLPLNGLRLISSSRLKSEYSSENRWTPYENPNVRCGSCVDGTHGSRDFLAFFLRSGASHVSGLFARCS